MRGGGAVKSDKLRKAFVVISKKIKNFAAFKLYYSLNLSLSFPHSKNVLEPLISNSSVQYELNAEGTLNPYPITYDTHVQFTDDDE